MTTLHDYEMEPWAQAAHEQNEVDRRKEMDAAAITAFGQYIVMPLAGLGLFVAMLYFGTKK